MEILSLNADGDDGDAMMAGSRAMTAFIVFLASALLNDPIFMSNEGDDDEDDGKDDDTNGTRAKDAVQSHNCLVRRRRTTTFLRVFVIFSVAMLGQLLFVVGCRRRQPYRLYHPFGLHFEEKSFGFHFIEMKSIEIHSSFATWALACF